MFFMFDVQNDRQINIDTGFVFVFYCIHKQMTGIKNYNRHGMQWFILSSIADITIAISSPFPMKIHIL